MASTSWKIYSYPNNPRVNKALIAAEYGGLTIETPQFAMGKDNKSKEFLAKFPTGKVPALETPEGNVFESNAIARHVARHVSSKFNLLGRSEIEQGQVDQWIDFCSGEIDLPAAAWLYPIYKLVPLHKEATEKAKADIKKTMLLLHNHLNTRTFLVGERITLADIVVAMSLQGLFTTVLEPAFRKPYGNVLRWFTTVVNQPQVRKVVGEVKLCTKMAVAEEPPAQAAPAKAEPKAAEPKAAAKPADAGAGEDGEEDTKSKKKANPLDALPKSKLEMDEWKRTYSNTPKIKGEAMPWFWDHYDPEGYSIYYSVYKYNDELNALFKTANLVGGFLQRLDALRKYGFGSVLIFGDNEDAPTKSEISGVWLFRGTTIPPEMSENEEAAHHEFKKLEPTTNEADKKLVEDYWAWEGDFNGKPLKCLQGKTYK